MYLLVIIFLEESLLKNCSARYCKLFRNMNIGKAVAEALKRR